MTATPESLRRWRDWILAALLILGTVVVFLPALDNDFVDWDDVENLVNNPHYRGLSGPQLRWMWSSARLGHYIPVTWMTLGLDYVLWQMDPSGYHLTNLLLHAANAAVFYLIALRLLGAALPSLGATPRRIGSVFAALLFAVHPLRVESVAWVTERRDVLFGLFYLLAILAYLRYCEASAAGTRRGRWAYWGSVACCGLALLSKSMAVSLPVILLLLDIYPLRRLGGGMRTWLAPHRRAVLIEKIPFVLLAAGAALVALTVLGSSGGLSPLAKVGLRGRIAVSLYALSFYLWKMLLPLDLSPLYELPLRLNPVRPAFLISGLTVLAVTVLALVQRRQWPALAVVWTAYVVVLLPVLGIAHNGPQLAADRYTYLASSGWCLLGGAGVALAWQRRRALQPVVTALAAVVVVTFAGLTWKQVHVWRDTDTLWTHALAVSPSARAYMNVGLMLGRQGRLAEGIDHLREALRINPAFPEAYNAMGMVLAEQGRTKEAAEYLQLALRINPKFADAHNNLGLALADQDRLPEAIAHFETALRLNPDLGDARRNLELALKGEKLVHR
jgi:tetratricopeptide (TPR) repeat protein